MTTVDTYIDADYNALRVSWWKIWAVTSCAKFWIVIARTRKDSFVKWYRQDILISNFTSQLCGNVIYRYYYYHYYYIIAMDPTYLNTIYIVIH